MAAKKEPQRTHLPDKRREAILRAALSIFTQKGLEATTIDDIRRESGTSVGCIYHHFQTKEGVAAALIAQGLDDYWQRFSASVEGKADVRAMIDGLLWAHLDWIVEKPDLARLLFSSELSVIRVKDAAVREKTEMHFKRLLAAFKPFFEAGVLRTLHSELYVPLLLGPANELARQWLAGKVTRDPREVVEALRVAACSLLLNPDVSTTTKGKENERKPRRVK